MTNNPKTLDARISAWLEANKPFEEMRKYEGIERSTLCSLAFDLIEDRARLLAEVEDLRSDVKKLFNLSTAFAEDVVKRPKCGCFFNIYGEPGYANDPNCPIHKNKSVESNTGQS